MVMASGCHIPGWSSGKTGCSYPSNLSPLERQVLPRCPGNSWVLRFTGKRQLIHWDVSLQITLVPVTVSLFPSLSCFASASVLTFLWFSALLPPHHYISTLAWGRGTRETPGFWRHSPGCLPITTPRPTKVHTYTHTSCATWAPPEVSSTPCPPDSLPPKGPQQSGLLGLLSQFLLVLQVKVKEAKGSRGEVSMTWLTRSSASDNEPV